MFVAKMMLLQSSLSSHRSRAALVRYSLATAAVLVTLAVAYFLNSSGGTPLAYILLFPPIAFAAWWFGVGPAAISAGIAVSGLRFWFVSPSHSFRVPNSTQSVCLLAFLLACAGVIALGEVRRRENENLRRAQRELDDRVRERTAELDTANNSLRDLSARLLQLQDDERRRLARELHDSVGQLLAGLSMNLAAVRGDIDRLNKTAAALTDSEALVQEMSKEVRTISHLLHPPLLDEAGLESAIRWYVDGFVQRSKIAVDLDLPRELGRLPREMETAVFRVMQECLTNIHRHSGSPTARIRLRRHNGAVLVEIEDKGRGIPLEKREKISVNGTPGVGIRGMRERLRQLGGTLDINSTGAGTVVTARLPVAETSLAIEDSTIPDRSSITAA
jgi:signal transduction histidine kinase